MAGSKKLIWSTVLILVLLASAGCDVFTTPQERVARAERLLDEGKNSEAMVELKNALSKQPKDARVQLTLARASLMLGDAEATSRALDSAVQNGADQAAVSDMRSQVYLQLGQFEKLLKSLDDGELALAEPQRSVMRARALLGLRRFDAAIELARQLRGKDAATVPASVVMAQSFAQLGNSKGALLILDTAVARQPTAAEAWLARGRLQQLLGLRREAEESWAKAAQYAPGQLNVPQQLNMFAVLADLQMARNDTAAANATYQRALRVGPQGVLTAVLAARLALIGGETEKAAASLHELVNRNPRLDEARVALISALIAAGNLQQATQRLVTLAQENPRANNIKVAADIVRPLDKANIQREEYWLSVAAAQLALDQPAMARLALAHAASLAPQSLRVTGARAQLELSVGNADEALRLLQTQSDKQPEDSSMLALLAETHRAKKQYAEAAAALEQLWSKAPSASVAVALYRARSEGALGRETEVLQQWLVRNPQDVNLRGVLADAMMRAGMNREAIAEYEQLLVIAPDSVPALNNLAWLYHLTKDPRALATARHAWQRAPRSINVADTYGWLLVEQGAQREGLNILEAAYHDGGIAHPDILYHYAAALARGGAHERASELLAALLADVPEFPSRAEAVKLADELRG